ncbi:OmpH family outer membrane protein [Puniceicoccaceae bacterium K14]|nr:OmpH family outer membrane protein [Puniceicoccaceae bacterium K14]
MIRLKSLITVCALALASISAQAENVILTVNVNSAAQEYYKVKALMEELGAVKDQAQEQVESMEEGGKELVQEFEELVEQAKSEILTEEARKDAEKDALAKRSEIQAKENEIREYLTNTERSMAARQQTQMSVFVKEIVDVIEEIREARGATLVLDSSGASNNGLPTILYTAPENDITEEVIEKVNSTQTEE